MTAAIYARKRSERFLNGGGMAAATATAARGSGNCMRKVSAGLPLECIHNREANTTAYNLYVDSRSRASRRGASDYGGRLSAMFALT